MALPRGARPSPRHRLAAAAPHRIVGVTPSQAFWKPCQLSMWKNDIDGDCVTAEEAFAKACSSPQVFITDDTVLAWATAGGFLNGADLDTVLQAMQSGGFQQDGKTYDDGPASAVDWTNSEVLQNAIWIGPVKIGIAADQVEAAYEAGGTKSGWVGTGFTTDQNEDHCVSICGFGTFAYLAEQIGVSLPDGIDPNTQGYAIFTWDSLGIIDVPSLLAICGEAWVRNPGTIVN